MTCKVRKEVWLARLETASCTGSRQYSQPDKGDMAGRSPPPAAAKYYRSVSHPWM
ncbi:MAG: hypothetical protein GY696_39940 [Gammaproteobacteria bacterium]|nr:hypothetical protein [Gammaproteobacteria bacterium]